MPSQFLHIPIEPVPAPRQTQSDKWKKRPCVMRYRAFGDALSFFLTDLPEAFQVIFVLPMPGSWSTKRRREMEGKPHKSRPDLDNIQKSLCDSVLKEDAHIHTILASKIWGYSGAILIRPLPEDVVNITRVDLTHSF